VPERNWVVSQLPRAVGCREPFVLCGINVLCLILASYQNSIYFMQFQPDSIIFFQNKEEQLKHSLRVRSAAMLFPKLELLGC
jgi:hypothetical protein